MTITTLIFDFFDVLTTNGGWPQVAKELARHCAIDEATILEKVRAQETLYLLGKEDTESFWKRICDGTDISFETFSRILAGYDINEEMLAIIAKLKKHFQIILLSDNVSLYVNEIRKDPRICKLFDKMYFSNEIGLSKRNKSTRLYEYALADIKRRPEECLFIDDRAENIEAAKGIGIRTILFKDINGFRNDLKAYIK